jgi:hypothetical protein
VRAEGGCHRVLRLGLGVPHRPPSLLGHHRPLLLLDSSSTIQQLTSFSWIYSLTLVRHKNTSDQYVIILLSAVCDRPVVVTWLALWRRGRCPRRVAGEEEAAGRRRS